MCSITMTTSLLIICILTCLTGLPKYNKALKNKLCCYTLLIKVSSTTIYINIFYTKQTKKPQRIWYFSHQSLRSGYLLHSESYFQLLRSCLQQHHHYPASTRLTSDYLWQVDENAVTHRQKTLKLEKKESWMLKQKFPILSSSL